MVCESMVDLKLYGIIKARASAVHPGLSSVPALLTNSKLVNYIRGIQACIN